MSKKNLQNIIDQNNMWAKITDKAMVMDIDSLTPEHVKALYESIDCGLSPENLHCDGEISRTQAQAKYRNYMGAVKELMKMGHPVPKDCYEI